MNGFLLAAIVVVVLLIAVLLLKKRSSLNKTSQIEADDRAETAVGPVEPTPLEYSSTQPDSSRESGEPAEAVSAIAAEESVVPLDAEVISAIEPVGFDLEEATPLANVEEDLFFVEPEEIDAEFSEEVIGKIEKTSVTLEGAEPVSLELAEVPAQGEVHAELGKKEEAVSAIAAIPSVVAVKAEERNGFP
jgi:hypothetical protein